MSELQGACSVALNVMMTNLFADCEDAVATLCSDSSSGAEDESVYVLSCLSNHQSELSAECQKQVCTHTHSLSSRACSTLVE